MHVAPIAPMAPAVGAAGPAAAGVCILHQSQQGKVQEDVIGHMGFKLRFSSTCLPVSMACYEMLYIAV